MGPACQISQVGDRGHHRCKLHAPVPPANPHHLAWAWVVMMMRRGLNWEETVKLLQCLSTAGLSSHMQLYQKPLLQPGSQAE